MSSNMDELLRRALMEANALDAEEISAPPGIAFHVTSVSGPGAEPSFSIGSTVDLMQPLHNVSSMPHKISL